MLKVELYERIRRDSRIEGLSVRALAARHHVHRRTVRLALSSDTVVTTRDPSADTVRPETRGSAR